MKLVQDRDTLRTFALWLLNLRVLLHDCWLIKGSLELISLQAQYGKCPIIFGIRVRHISRIFIFFYG
jgi:hypothetical protein